MDVLNSLMTHKVVAVIRLDDLTHAEQLSKALLAGGIRILEFTLTNPDTYDVVAHLRTRLPDAVIGIGSIRTGEQARLSISSGAQFLVSPILQLEMVRIGQEAQVVTAPAGYTPTELSTAYQSGADLVKVFPADTLGAKYIKGVLAAMPDLKLMPTGGVGVNNIADYIKAGAVAVGVGGALVNQKLVDAQDWQALEDTARQYINAIGGHHAL